MIMWHQTASFKNTRNIPPALLNLLITREMIKILAAITDRLKNMDLKLENLTSRVLMLERK